ncbi:hypothetical protein L6452_34504 [Arctium lappa]|uniref:Uncharacterized protein n=1 Tax=Arctium lappa TaxID=4217 RepID=A0ACB8YIX9_ARCLA|nr:hypothetical protein L6452_34504 [Arctium lappa]
MAMVVYEAVYTPTEIDACWESPTFVAEVFETVEIEVQKSEEKKSSSKSKDQDFVNKDKDEDKDEGVEQVQATLRENRREKRLGDHLRSPYVQRCVDFNVTTEEKRVHEWALAALGDTLDHVFLGKDDTYMNRVSMESLAANISVKKEVIDTWASVLNYEEQYQNCDSPKRYFFNTNIVGDLQMRNININLLKMYGSDETWQLQQGPTNMLCS